MVEVDAVRIEKNFGRTGGVIVHVHVIGYGWHTLEEFAARVGESHAEIAALKRDMDDWAERAPLWVQ